MTNESKPRVQKVLAELYEAQDPIRPREIADKIGETSLNVGKDIHRLKARGLAESTGEGTWVITQEGRAWLEGGAEGEKGESEGEKGKGKETLPETVPSQTDLFRSIGEKLGIGARKGDIRLDAIAYYVQRTADLDNLTSVWNALSEMGIANDVKKRWIKIYAQNIPGKKIPEELREKLEAGLEAEKIKVETGDIPAKPRRFSVVNGEIIGDPEGDYSFKEALQCVATQRGASPDEAGSLALELSKSMLDALTPLLNKEPLSKGGEGALLSQLDSLGLLKKSGEEGRATQLDILDKINQLGLLKKPGEEDAGSQTIRALETQVKELADSLRKQEMDTVKSAVVTLANQVGDMRKEMSNQGRLEGRFAILDKTISTIDNQISGIRSDARPVLDSLAHRGGPGPTIKSPEEKRKISKGLKDAVGLEQQARALEDHLLFGQPLPEKYSQETAPPKPAPPKEPAATFSYE